MSKNLITPRLGLSDKYKYTKYERALLYYQSNPVEACRDIINKDPIWFQRATLRDLWNKPYCLLKWGRGSSKCLWGKDLQYLADTGEYVQIEKLCGHAIKVLAMDSEHKLVVADAAVKDNGIAECYRVRLRSGRTIHVTEEHPFYTVHGWVPIKDLRHKDMVAVVRQMPHKTNESVSRNKSRLLGSLIENGRVNTGDNNPDIEQWLIEMDVFGENSHYKTVPSCVYTWNLEDISNFIGAYFDCNGTVNTNDNSISITSVSEELLKGIQRLLLKFGILSNIKKNKTFRLHIYGQSDVSRFIEKIYTISDKLSRLNMAKTCVSINTELREKLDRHDNEIGVDDAVKTTDPDICWDEIELIKSIGRQQTYSVEVPRYHNFVADTIITHNTFTVAMYVVLRAVLIPDSRIGIIAPSYRQTSYVFDEIEDIYHNSPFIRQSAFDPPKRGTDRSLIKFHNRSFIEGLPIGADGKKIRGRRYTCLEYNSLILTENGFEKIGDIVENAIDTKFISPIGNSEFVNGYLKKYVKNLFRINLSHGYYLEGSGDHPIMVDRNGKEQLLTFSEIETTDKIKLHNLHNRWKPKEYINIDTNRKIRNKKTGERYNCPNIVNEDMAMLLGYLVSEGDVSQESLIGFSQVDKIVADHYISLFSSLFGCEPRIYKTERNGTQQTCYNINKNSIDIRTLLLDIGLKRNKARTKSVPWSIMQSNKKVIRSFLKTLFESGGCLCISNNKLSVSYDSASNELIQQVQQLLLIFGIYSTAEYNEFGYRGKTLKSRCNKLKMHDRDAAKFIKEIGFITKCKDNNELNNIMSKYNDLDNEYEYRQMDVVDVDIKQQRTITYDIELSDKHLFYANGVVSHNCIFLDEYAQMDEETVRLVIRPMLAVMRGGRRNQLIVASSPFFKFNHFWDRYQYYSKAVTENPDDYHCSSHNLVDVVIAKHKQFQIDLKMVREAYDSDPEDSFLMEWMGIFPDETSGFFPNTLIEDCTPRGIREIIPIECKGDPEAEYVMGIDPARSEHGDMFSISILKICKNDTKQVVKIIAYRGLPFPKMAEAIQHEIFINKFNVVAIYMDSRGGGKELQDLLSKPWVHKGNVYPAIVVQDDILSGIIDGKDARGILRMVDFNIRSINEMYFKYKADMERRRILFPLDLRRHPDPEIEEIAKEIVSFKNEMRVIQTMVTAHGLKFSVPKRFTKDRLTSTILANLAATEYTDSEINESQMVDNLLSMGQWMSAKGG